MKQTAILPSLLRNSDASQPLIFCLSSMPGGPAAVGLAGATSGDRGRGAGISPAFGSVGRSSAMSNCLPQSFSQASASSGKSSVMAPLLMPAPSECSRSDVALSKADSTPAASAGWNASVPERTVKAVAGKARSPTTISA
jgi:hypothetical protein